MDLISEFQKSVNDHHINAHASNVSFYILLSIFPFLMGMTEIFRLTALADPLLQSELWNWLPANTYEMIQKIMEDLSSNKSQFTLPIIIVITMWSSSKGAMALLRGLQIAFRQEENRNYILNRIFAFFYTIGFIALVFINGLILVFGQMILELMQTHLNFSLSKQFYQLKDWLPFLMIFFMISLAYYVIVRKQYRFIYVLPGALLATLGFKVSAVVMTYYIRFSANLSYMYGSIAGVAGMMMWLNICSLCILLGAEINAMLKDKLFSS